MTDGTTQTPFDPRDLLVSIERLRETVEARTGANAGFAFGFGFWIGGCVASILIGLILWVTLPAFGAWLANLGH